MHVGMILQTRAPVLNRNDMPRLLYSAAMIAEEPSPSPQCPDPLARAPRADRTGGIDTERLYLAPLSLQGAMVALISRDTRALALDSPQRLTHIPASPLVTLSWFHDMDVGLVEADADGPGWRSFGASVVIAGSQSHSTVSWAPSPGRGYMACFTADTAQALFDVDLSAIHDAFLPARQVLGSKWSSLCDELLGAADDAATMAVLEARLGERWRAVQGRTSPLPSLRQLGRHWVERLAWQAQEWRRAHGPRQVERRVKSFSGRSLRHWQALVRTEGLFFAARDRYETGQEYDWAALAQDEGFADQAHMSRVAKRITGFAPGEFAQRFAEDESFWLYRLWV